MKNTLKKSFVIFAALTLLLSCLLLLPACNNYEDDGRYYFDEDTRFAIDDSKLKVMGIDFSEPGMSLIYKAVTSLALNMDETYFDFNADGTMHAQIKTKDGLLGNLDELFKLIQMDSSAVEDMLSGIDLSDGLKTYAEPMFPGFTAYLEQGDLESALGLLKRSLGLNIEGFDYDNEDIKYVLDYVGKNKALPGDLLARLPKDTVLTLTFDTHYLIRDIEGEDGTAYSAIYLGDDVANRNTVTNPFCVFTLNENDKGVLSAVMVVEFMNVTIGLKQQ